MVAEDLKRSVIATPPRRAKIMVLIILGESQDRKKSIVTDGC
jgi:hypothetical protein